MDQERDKTSRYAQGYAMLSTPWAFAPIACSTYCHLRPYFLRLLHLLAEHQTARDLKSVMRGEQPDRLLKMNRHRILGRVSCAVAKATAYRLGSSWADIHHTARRPWPHRQPPVGVSASLEGDRDLPLFPRGSEDAPFASTFPLPRGSPANDLFASDEWGG